MPEQSHQLVAIMFTDIVGYTALMDEDEDKAIHLLEKNRSIQKPVIENHNGKLLKEMGDGMLASFPAVSDAVYCAKEILLACQGVSDLILRIGIHLGEVIIQDDDVFGSGVNIASRLEKLAPAGGIWVSESVHKNVINKKGIETKFVREEALKNVREPIRIYEVNVEGGESPLASATQPSVDQHKSGIKNEVKIGGGIFTVLLIVYVIWQYGFRETSSTSQTTIDNESEKSIAVLPFKNLSKDEENQYFADGIMDGILHNLSKIKDLRVISRSSTEKYRDNIPQVQQIAEELNVSYLLEASVFRSEDKIRVTAQLLNARSDEHIWSEQYDRVLSDVFEVMSDISQQVASEVEVVLSPEVKKRIETIPTENLEAYNLYLQGRYFWNQLRGRKDDLDKSIEYYKRALEIDPNFALAYSGIATTYTTYAWYGYSSRRDVIPLAKEAAMKALEIDNTLGEAHAELAFARLVIDWDWSESEKGFKSGLELNPNYARGHNLYAWLLTDLGRFDEAIEESKRSHELDPLSVRIWVDYGRRYYFARDYDNAIEEYRKVLEVFPNSGRARSELALALSQKGMHNEAIEEYLKTDFEAQRSWRFGYIYGVAGKREKSLEILNYYLERSKKEFVMTANIAFIYIGLGEKDKAFEWLEKTYMQREAWLTELKVEPMYDNLRSDPRFQDLVERVNFPD